MKPIFSAVAFASLFSMAACNNSAIIDRDAVLQAQKHTIDSMNIELAKKKVVDSMNEVSRTSYVFPGIATPAATQPMRTSTVVTTTPVRRVINRRYVSTSRRTYYRSYGGSRYAAAQPVVYEQAPVRRRGWSAKAKGAVIGAGSGAIIGAAVNGRNRLAGGVIGSLLGAGAGTGIGAIIDRRNGR